MPLVKLLVPVNTSEPAPNCVKVRALPPSLTGLESIMLSPASMFNTGLPLSSVLPLNGKFPLFPLTCNPPASEKLVKLTGPMTFSVEVPAVTFSALMTASVQPLTAPRFKVWPPETVSPVAPASMTVPPLTPARLLPATIQSLLLGARLSTLPAERSKVVTPATLLASTSPPLSSVIGAAPSGPVAGPGEA